MNFQMFKGLKSRVGGGWGACSSSSYWRFKQTIENRIVLTAGRYSPWLKRTPMHAHTQTLPCLWQRCFEQI